MIRCCCCDLLGIRKGKIAKVAERIECKDEKTREAESEKRKDANSWYKGWHVQLALKGGMSGTNDQES